jgi:hypothetical protein
MAIFWLWKINLALEPPTKTMDDYVQFDNKAWTDFIVQVSKLMLVA